MAERMERAGNSSSSCEKMIVSDLLRMAAAERMHFSWNRRCFSMRVALATLAFFFVCTAHPSFAQCADISDKVSEIHEEWVRAYHQTSGQLQLDAFEALLAKSRTYVDAHPDSAELLIWDGIVNASFAGIAGITRIFKYLKMARNQLLESIRIDPLVLEGSAHTALGTLYYKVPGFPISFGNTKKAEYHLKKALEVNPEGIDPNYFYGDFLMEQGRYGEAVMALNKAKAAPDRPHRQIEDTIRRNEIERVLELVHARAE